MPAPLPNDLSKFSPELWEIDKLARAAKDGSGYFFSRTKYRRKTHAEDAAAPLGQFQPTVVRWGGGWVIAIKAGRRPLSVQRMIDSTRTIYAHLVFDLYALSDYETSDDE